MAGKMFIKYFSDWRSDLRIADVSIHCEHNMETMTTFVWVLKLALLDSNFCVPLPI